MIVPRRRNFRVIVTLVAMCAVIALAVLPAAHFHRKASGETVVHSHVVATADAHAGLENGDHHDAVLTLEPSFTFVKTLYIDAPIAVEVAVLVARPVASVRRAAVFDAEVIHGPPLPVLSPRAPPL